MSFKHYQKVKILPDVPGGTWDDGEPLGTIVFASAWNGTEPYHKGKHTLYPGDYFYGFDEDVISPYVSRFARKEKFEEMYKELAS